MVKSTIVTTIIPHNSPMFAVFFSFFFWLLKVQNCRACLLGLVPKRTPRPWRTACTSCRNRWGEPPGGHKNPMENGWNQWNPWKNPWIAMKRLNFIGFLDISIGSWEFLEGLDEKLWGEHRTERASQIWILGPTFVADSVLPHDCRSHCSLGLGISELWGIMWVKQL